MAAVMHMKKEQGFYHLVAAIILTIFDPMGIMDIPAWKNGLSECSTVLQ